LAQTDSQVSYEFFTAGCDVHQVAWNAMPSLLCFTGAQAKPSRQQKALTTSSAVTVSREGDHATSGTTSWPCIDVNTTIRQCVFSHDDLHADVIINNQANNVTDNIFQKIGVNLHQ